MAFACVAHARTWGAGAPARSEEGREAPLYVKNTFLDCAEPLPSSLEDFYLPRRTTSCPANCGSLSDSGSDADAPDFGALPRGKSQPYWPGEQLVRRLRKAMQRTEELPEATTPPQQPQSGAQRHSPLDLARKLTAAFGRSEEGPRSATSGCSTAAPPTPNSEAEPSLGQALAGELPSLGSVEHGTGRCKPCVFVGKRGCRSGSECTFCHLCDPGEKKRRQKEKRAFFSAMKRMGQEAPEAADGEIAASA